MTHAQLLTRLIAAIAGTSAVHAGCAGSSKSGDPSTGPQEQTVDDEGAGGKQSVLEPPPQCQGQFQEACYGREQLENMIRIGGGQIPISPTPTDEEVAAAFMPSGCLPADRTFDGCCNPAVAGPEQRGATCCYIHCTGACCGRPLIVGRRASHCW